MKHAEQELRAAREQGEGLEGEVRAGRMLCASMQRALLEEKDERVVSLVRDLEEQVQVPRLDHRPQISNPKP